MKLSYFLVLWKLIVIIMILKTGKPPDSPNSYRDIGLLLLFTKMFGKIMLKQTSLS